METKYLSTAETAKLIRKSLDKAFPTVKFSVRISRGGSVNINWSDGPTTKQVDDVAGAYQAGRFDASIDYGYSVSHWLLPDGSVQIARNPGSACTMGYDEGCDNPQPHPDAIKVRFGARFVFTNRRYSAGMVRRALDKVARQWGGFEPADLTVEESGIGAWVSGAGSIRIDNAGRYLDELLHRELSRRTTVASVAA
jgi:hypothetical protein